MDAENEKAPANAEARMGEDGNPLRSLSWRFPPVPTLTVQTRFSARTASAARDEAAVGVPIKGWRLPMVFGRQEVRTYETKRRASKNAPKISLEQ